VVARTQTIVQLNDSLLSVLDQRAARQGVARSKIIRDAIEAYLRQDLDAEISRRTIAGYERLPQATVDEWGAVATFTATTARDLHRRLDAEERDAGPGPW
jgi:predicted DNA-binding protein